VQGLAGDAEVRWNAGMPTHVEPANEIFHNRQRRHPSIGMYTPIEYETIHRNQPAALLSQVT
jgi:hypothetical protein